MSGRPIRDDAAAALVSDAASGKAQDSGLPANPTVTAPRWEVQVINPATGRPKTFSKHDTREAAEREAAKMRGHQFFAQVRRVEVEPEYRADRRAFLIAMCAIGAVPPERVVERVLHDLEGAS